MRHSFLILLFFIPTIAFAQGGPPMVTDDPGTPGDGHWELNIASLYAGSRDKKALEAPYFDINYGWGERVQLKVETGFINVWDPTSGNRSGTGATLFGVKYRFLDEATSGVSVSTYPQVQLRPFFSSRDPDIAEPGTRYVMPLEFVETFGNWAFNPEVGSIIGTNVPDEVMYGLVVAYENLKPWEPLAEVHITSWLDGTGSTTLMNFGFRYAQSSAVNLIGALGRSWTTESDLPDEIDLYLGFQFEL